MRRIVQLMCSAVLFVWASTLSAQDEPRAAIVLGGPAPVGVLVPLGPRWMVRAGVGLGRSENRMDGTTRSSTQYSTAIGVQRALGRPARARPYVGLDVRRNASNTEGSDLESYEAAAIVGARAQVAGRLGLFAEAGPSFVYSEWVLRNFLGTRSLTVATSLTLSTRLGATWQLGRTAPERE